MKIALIGAGCGPLTLTQEARLALSEAELLLGAKRLMDTYADFVPRACERAEAVAPDAIVSAIANTQHERACVLLSGDVGFYSGARRLLPLLGGHETRLLPGVSSVQAFAARLGRPWQDWTLCSAHGVDCDVLSLVCGGKPVFLLTAGAEAPAEICRTLTGAGLGALPVTVGQALGSPGEQIVSAPASELALKRFLPLNVMLLEAAPRFSPRAPGLPDAMFERAEGVPMTKQEVRAALIAKLGVTPDDICWDVGAGTGSVSVELALCSRAVWAVERDAAALKIARDNREKFCAWNLRLLAGEAPEALRGLPAPDKVFVGGTGGGLREVLRAVHAAKSAARVCVSAVTLESLHQAVSELEALGWETEITQIAVTRSRRAGGMHMMLAQNPVYLIVGYAV